MKEKLLIAVDGPAGVGKSTVSRELAKRMSYRYLDTGSLYRALAYKAAERNVPFEERSLCDFCSDITLSVCAVNGTMQIWADGENVTSKIGTELVGVLASKISKIPCVRQALLSYQREIACEGGIVAEGRDMGTVVFPYADVKFFLDASVCERVSRRYRQLLENGLTADLKDVKDKLIARDYSDSTRNISPLKQAEDAILIDTTCMNHEEVLEQMLKVIRRTMEKASQRRDVFEIS